MSIFSRMAEWWSRLEETGEDERCRLGMSSSEYYREVQRPRSMREHGCATVEEYDALRRLV